MIKLMSAPIRRVLRFPLLQFAVVIFLILWMEAAGDKTVLGQAYGSLDKLVDSSIAVTAAIFSVKSFTKSFLTFGFMIAYVYLVCWLILSAIRILMRLCVDFLARRNILWLRSTVAKERGIDAYRAWLPLEKIRPAHVPQSLWEETYAWPRDNQPPYPPIIQRVLRGIVVYCVLIALVVALLQAFSPLPAYDWLVSIVKRITGV
jgi:hypothetical protein